MYLRHSGFRRYKTLLYRARNRWRHKTDLHRKRLSRNLNNDKFSLLLMTDMQLHASDLLPKMRIRFGTILSLLMRQINDENTVWTDSQDYRADEILCISKKRYFIKQPDSQAKLSLFSGFLPNYSPIIQLLLPSTWRFAPWLRGKPSCGILSPHWEGQRPRCPRFAAVWATRTLPLPGFASASIISTDPSRSERNIQLTEYLLLLSNLSWFSEGCVPWFFWRLNYVQPPHDSTLQLSLFSLPPISTAPPYHHHPLVVS